MSSVRSRVKRALSDEQSSGTSGQSETGPTGSGSSTGGMGRRETSSLTGEELTEAVKKGLTEALEERAEQKQEGELTSTGDSTEESTSSRGPPMKRLLVLGTLVAIGILARRRLQDEATDVLDTTTPDEPDE